MTSNNTVADSVGFGQLLRQNSRFRNLWIAQLISAAGDWFNSVAVLGLVFQLTQSGLAVSFVLIASTLPAFFLTPIAGPIADRIDRRTIMIWTNVFSAGVALMFLLVHDSNTVWIAYLAAVLLIGSASFFIPASSASIPNIAAKNELFAANALSGSTWGIMVMVGSALGGIVSTLFGRDIAFIINAMSFLIAAGIIAMIDIPSPKRESYPHPLRDFVDGLGYLRDHLSSLALVSVKTGWGLAAGVLVLLTVFGQQVFKAGDAGIGALYAARGFGALVGPLVFQRLVGLDVTKLRKAMWLSFFLSAGGYALFAVAGWANALWLGLIALAIAHFGGGTTWIISSLILQISTPDKLRGRVLAVDNGLNTLTNGVSTLLFGIALQNGAVPMQLALLGGAIFGAFGLVWGLITAQGRFKVSNETVSMSASTSGTVAGH